jgi:hypothetical protein
MLQLIHTDQIFEHMNVTGVHGIQYRVERVNFDIFIDHRDFSGVSLPDTASERMIYSNLFRLYSQRLYVKYVNCKIELTFTVKAILSPFEIKKLHIPLEFLARFKMPKSPFGTVRHFQGCLSVN